MWTILAVAGLVIGFILGRVRRANIHEERNARAVIDAKERERRREEGRD